jgi:hypothetical protein
MTRASRMRGRIAIAVYVHIFTYLVPSLPLSFACWLKWLARSSNSVGDINELDMFDRIRIGSKFYLF